MFKLRFLLLAGWALVGSNASAAPGIIPAGQPVLHSASALVIDRETGQVLYSKSPDTVTPIASITKLMTALVTLDANLPMTERISILEEDKDMLKGSHSRLHVGSFVTRHDLLHIALMASENRAAAALGRTYPGGPEVFVRAMNAKAQLLGMSQSRFFDPTGLSSENVSSARDLSRLINAAYMYPAVREMTTSTSYAFDAGGHTMQYKNSNRLVGSSAWDIGLSKTGYISEAGRCLVMQAKMASRDVAIVLLDSQGKLTRLADSLRIKQWLEGVTVSRPTRLTYASPRIKVKHRVKHQAKRRQTMTLAANTRS